MFSAIKKAFSSIKINNNYDSILYKAIHFNSENFQFLKVKIIFRLINNIFKISYFIMEYQEILRVYLTIQYKN